jgi:hypothetical protein
MRRYVYENNQAKRCPYEYDIVYPLVRERTCQLRKRFTVPSAIAVGESTGSPSRERTSLGEFPGTKRVQLPLKDKRESASLDDHVDIALRRVSQNE